MLIKVAINKRYKLYSDFVSSNNGMNLRKKDLLAWVHGLSPVR